MFLKFVPQAFSGVRSTFGRYTATLKPGLNWYIPVIQKIDMVSHRRREFSVNPAVITQDRAQVHMEVAVHMRVPEDKAFEACFAWEFPVDQINSHIADALRGKVSGLKVDDLSENRDSIAKEVLADVVPNVAPSGYELCNILIKEITPPASVVKSMNQINESVREKIVVQTRGEAAKIKAVLEAEAEAERQALRGDGIRRMRVNVMNGWESSVQTMAEKLALTPKEAMVFMEKVLHLDTLGEIGKSDNTKTLFLNHNPDLIEALEATAIAGQRTKRP